MKSAARAACRRATGLASESAATTKRRLSAIMIMMPAVARLFWRTKVKGLAQLSPAYTLFLSCRSSVAGFNSQPLFLCPRINRRPRPAIRRYDSY